jgi:hypothetical protein
MSDKMSDAAARMRMAMAPQLTSCCAQGRGQHQQGRESVAPFRGGHLKAAVRSHSFTAVRCCLA